MSTIKNVLLISALLAMLTNSVGRLWAFPEPSLVSTAWHLNFTNLTPRTIAARALDGQLRWYWYMPYKVVNNTDSEQFLIPEITVATDKGDIITAGRGIRASVFNAIRKRLNNPLLKNPVQVSGRVLIGEDNAVESVAIWPFFEHDVDVMRIFVAGLSGETHVIQHPVTQESVALRKTIMQVYETPGTSMSPHNQPINLRSHSWVMR